MSPLLGPSCLLLLGLSHLVLGDAPSPAPALPEITAHNWIELSPGTWPQAEPSKETEPFRFFHTESLAAHSLALAPGLIPETALLDTAILSFKYWANHYLASFRTQIGNAAPDTLPLDIANNWTEIELSFSDASYWNNTKLVGVGAGYTLALKDIKVIYSLNDTTVHQETVLCHSPTDCSNIFTVPLLVSRLYAPPTATPNDRRFFPYQADPSLPLTSSYLTVSVTPPPTSSPNDDYCFDLYYSSPGSPLLLSSSLSSQFSIELPAEAKLVSKYICKSWFTPEVTSVTQLFLRLQTVPLEADLNRYLVGINGSTVEAQSEPVHLQGTRGLEKWESAFIEEKVNPFVEVAKFNLEKSGEIGFTIKGLQALKKGNGGKITRTLRTKWIQSIPNQKETLHLRLTPSGDASKDFLALSLGVNAPTGPLLESRNLKSLPWSVAVFNLSSSVDFYQLSFAYEIDLSQIGAQDQASVTLTGVTINDPCIGENFDEETCSNGQGTCTAVYETFNHTCACNDGFKGDTCEAIDYCNNAAKGVCGGHACLPQPELRSFKCDCDAKRNETWNIPAQACLGLSPICGEHERLVLHGTFQDCACVKGFIKLKDNVCEAYDVCNGEHRKANRLPVKACADAQAQCQATGGDQFECLCGEGFYNEFENKQAKARCLPKDCQGCEQKCTMDRASKAWGCACFDKRYTLEAGKCILQEGLEKNLEKCRGNLTLEGAPLPFVSGLGCGCAVGFTFNPKDKVCEVSATIGTRLGCKSGVELKSDGQPGCKCPVGVKFDASTRQCSTVECTEEKAGECGARDASCTVTPAGQAECTCKPGFVASGEDESEPSKTICIDACFVLNRPEYSQHRCTGQFEHCNSLAFKPANLIKGSFIYNVSTIAPDSAHCACEPGFSRFPAKTGACSLTPTRFIKDMEFDVTVTLPDEPAKTAYALGTITPAFTSLISTIFAVTPLIGQTSCTFQGATLLCSTAFNTKLTPDQIKAELNDNCILSKDLTTCAYMTPSETAGSKRSAVWFQEIDGPQVGASVSVKGMVNVISRDPLKEVKVVSTDYCANPARCRSVSPYSVCSKKTVASEELFECLCEPGLFSISSLVSLPVPGSPSESLRMESCTLRNLCVEQADKYGCADKTAVCSLLVEGSAGSLTPRSFCTCPDTHLVLPSKERHCADTCQGFCANGDCAADLRNASKVLCHCREGFSGERCQTKVQEKKTPGPSGVSKGYRTATIVLSVFFSLLLVVLLFIALKSFTGFNVVMEVSKLVRNVRNRGKNDRGAGGGRGTTGVNSGPRGLPEPGNIQMQRRD